MLCFRCGSYNADDAPRCTVCGQDLGDVSRKIPTGQHAAMIFVPGEVVAGRYKILDQIGAGGVGAVYRARDAEVDVDVALKGISPNLLQTDEEQKNFSKAIKAARKLQHPNIVRIYDEGMHQQPNRRFYTMKLLEGLTLRKIIRLRHDKGQAFSPDEIVPIFQQLAAALDYAHKQTWHGDLKPENVVVLPDLLKITDFNLVKALPLKPFLGIAKSRSKGFPYIAPELRVEAQTIDGRVDIYSLGVILAEMLTGIVYEGHFSKAFTAALEQLPTRLDGLVRRALAEHPDGRFPKASEMVKEVEAALQAMGSTPLPPPVAREPAHSLLPRPASFPPRPSPPPPPREETGPSSSGIKAPFEDDSLLELGQSQVLLLASEIKPARASAPPVDSQFDDTAGARPSSRSGQASSAVDSDLDSDVSRSQVGSVLAGLDSVPDAGSDTGSPIDDSLPSLDSDDVALAARRLMAIDSQNPDDTIDDPTLRGSPDDVDTNPGARPKKGQGRSSGKVGRAGLVSSGERAPGPDELLATIYSDEGDDKLIPPPLPENALGDDSIDGRLLPGDEDEPTHNRPQGPGATRSLPASELPSSEATGTPAAAAPRRGGGFRSLEPTADGQRSAAEALGLTSDEEAGVSSSSSSSSGGQPSSDGGLAIHDALTALKRHPRPDLVEDEALRDALTRTAGTEPAGPPPVPPPLEGDDDSLNDTRSLMKGPVVGDQQVPPAIVSPPPLRPVPPPRRSTPPSSGTNPVLIAAGVAVLVLVVLLVGRQLTKADPHEPSDGALVTLQPPTPPAPPPTPAPEPAPAPPPDVAAPPPPPDVAAPPPAPAPVVDDAAERALAEQRAREEMERREREALAMIKPPPSPAPAPSPSPSPSPAPVPAPEPVAVAVAEAGECPSGMAKIEAGSFSFGSSGSDPMRNFGELDASSVNLKAYCVDYYEAPNGAKSLPTTGVSWTAAKNTCEKSGKRLCTEQEWERACKGPGNSRFPYGNGYDVETCNTVDGEGKARPLARAVDFKKCRSGFKVYMLAGNAEEWVADAAGGQRVAKGGSSDRPDFASRCSARRTLAPRSASPMLGFRCCADLK